MTNPFFGQHKHDRREEKKEKQKKRKRRKKRKTKKEKRKKLKAKRYSSLHIQKKEINTHLPANPDKSVILKKEEKKVFDPTETPPHKIKREKMEKKNKTSGKRKENGRQETKGNVAGTNGSDKEKAIIPR